MTGPLADWIEELDLVLLARTADGLVPVAGSTPVDIDAGEPSPATVDALRGSSVTIAAGEIPLGLFDELARIPVPPAFAASPWLFRHRPLVFTGGAAQIGGWNLPYTPETGLVMPDADVSG